MTLSFVKTRTKAPTGAVATMMTTRMVVTTVLAHWFVTTASTVLNQQTGQLEHAGSPSDHIDATSLLLLLLLQTTPEVSRQWLAKVDTTATAARR